MDGLPEETYEPQMSGYERRIDMNISHYQYIVKDTEFVDVSMMRAILQIKKFVSFNIRDLFGGVCVPI